VNVSVYGPYQAGNLRLVYNRNSIAYGGLRHCERRYTVVYDHRHDALGDHFHYYTFFDWY
jgi:hypothetical protein